MLDFIVPRHSVKYSFKEYKTIFDYLFFNKTQSCDGSFKNFVKNKLKKDTFYGISLRVLFFHVLKYIKENINKKKSNAILFPEYSFPALVNAAKAARLKVFFYRVDNDLQVDLDSLKRLCKNIDPLAVVLSQHFGNIDSNSEKIKDFCVKNKTILLEDCAHAFANIKTYGDITFYSFGTGKDVVACGGGMIAFDSKKVEGLMEYLNNNSIRPSKNLVSAYLKSYLPEIIFSSFPFYHFIVFPVFYFLNKIDRRLLEKFMEEDDDTDFSKELYSMPEIMHRLLEINLKSVKKLWQKRKILGRIYKEELQEKILPSKSYLMVPYVLKDKQAKFEIAVKLMYRFIDVRMDYLKFYLPHPLEERILYLPSHPFVNKKHVRKIVKIVKIVKQGTVSR